MIYRKFSPEVQAQVDAGELRLEELDANKEPILVKLFNEKENRRMRLRVESAHADSPKLKDRNFRLKNAQILYTNSFYGTTDYHCDAVTLVNQHDQEMVLVTKKKADSSNG